MIKKFNSRSFSRHKVPKDRELLNENLSKKATLYTFIVIHISYLQEPVVLIYIIIITKQTRFQWGYKREITQQWRTGSGYE